jgi:SAM-dependent methyltransferase
MAYADITINDPNPLKRWIQRRRFRDAVEVLRSTTTPAAVLDFGGGDGELIYRCLLSYPTLQASLYEPTPALLNEAKAKLSRFGDVRVTGDLETLSAASFDVVFCLEVFEHLPRQATQEALTSIHTLLKPDGIAIIGVPHEILGPALLKGVFRMMRRYGAFDARPFNVLRATVGYPPRNRPERDIAPGFSYHHYHLGFDYRELERHFRPRFKMVSRWFSPLRMLGPALNSEVYYLLRRADV